MRVQQVVSLPLASLKSLSQLIASFRQLGCVAPEQSAPAVQLDTAGNDVQPLQASQLAEPGQSPPPKTEGPEHTVEHVGIKSCTHVQAGAHASTEQLEFAYEPESEPFEQLRVCEVHVSPQGTDDDW